MLLVSGDAASPNRRKTLKAVVTFVDAVFRLIEI